MSTPTTRPQAKRQPKAKAKAKKPRALPAPRHPAKWSHAWWVRDYSAPALEQAYRALAARNLRNQDDDEIRDQAARLKALAAERRSRKSGIYA